MKRKHKYHALKKWKIIHTYTNYFIVDLIIKGVRLVAFVISIVFFAWCRILVFYPTYVKDVLFRKIILP